MREPVHIELGATPLHSFFNAKKPGEIEPLEKGLHDIKAIASKEIEILLDAIRDQHILQSFSLAGYFDLRISPALLEIVIEVDEKAVQVAIVRENFLGDNQHTLINQGIVDITDDVISSKWSDKHESPAHCNHTRIT